ncbi:MAG: winged helix-turn-helix domain-containing protein [Pseudomonadota bacterium]
MDLAALTLFGRARYRVLACLFALGEAESLHLREIARRAGLSPTAAQYELRRLLAAGLVVQAGAAARPLYAANARHAVAPELREMIRKLDAAREPAAIADDAFWTRKRGAQRRDYAARTLARKSPFLADRRLAASLSADLRKDVSYDY